MSKKLLGEGTEAGVLFGEGTVLYFELVGLRCLGGNFAFELGDVFCVKMLAKLYGSMSQPWCACLFSVSGMRGLRPCSSAGDAPCC